ncbi:MAG TPA: hypothetical protein VF407_06550, partial [Polyangiaceae bacterium]
MRLRETPGRLRDAEVDQLHVAVERDDDVLRGDVAMHDRDRLAVLVFAGVRVGEAFADARENVEKDAERDLLLRAHRAIEHVAEVAAEHVLERDEERVADAPEVEHARDVRILEAHADARFVLEHADRVVVFGDVREHALQRDDGA